MATTTVTVQDMQQRLPELLSMVSNGKTIVIEKDKKPFARLVSIGRTPKRKKRIAGISRGAFNVSEDFDAPLPDEFWLGG